MNCACQLRGYIHLCLSTSFCKVNLILKVTFLKHLSKTNYKEVIEKEIQIIFQWIQSQIILKNINL